MIAYYLMAINRGDTKIMKLLGDYYQQIGQLEKMIAYYLMFIEDQHSIITIDTLFEHCKTDIKTLIKHIRIDEQIKYERRKYTRLVVNNLLEYVDQFRFQANSITMNILSYQFQLKNGLTEDLLYHQIKANHPVILNYLSITNSNHLIVKINQYINTWCPLSSN